MPNFSNINHICPNCRHSKIMLLYLSTCFDKFDVCTSLKNNKHFRDLIRRKSAICQGEFYHNWLNTICFTIILLRYDEIYFLYFLRQLQLQAKLFRWHSIKHFKAAKRLWRHIFIADSIKRERDSTIAFVCSQTSKKNNFRIK